MSFSAHFRNQLMVSRQFRAQDLLLSHFQQGASNTSTAPRKPPRRNVSVSPIRGCSSKHQFHTMSGSASKDQLMNYYSKTKSFDELDDILTSESNAPPAVSSSLMMKNSPSSSMMDEASASATSSAASASRHSCDELMMTRSLYEAETSDDAGSQVINIKKPIHSWLWSHMFNWPNGWGQPIRILKFTAVGA